MKDVTSTKDLEGEERFDGGKEGPDGDNYDKYSANLYKNRKRFNESGVF